MMSKENYTEAVRHLFHQAFRLAAEMRHKFVGSEHLLWGLARGEHHMAARVLQEAGLTQELVRALIERHNGMGDMTNEHVRGMTAEAGHVIEQAEVQAKKLNHKQVEPEHLLLSMLQEPDCDAAKLMAATGIELGQIATNVLAGLGKTWPRAVRQEKEKKANQTKTLDKYSTDLTTAAAEGRLDPVIGREDEIQRMVQILSRRTKNNPVLIGEPGVGKTAVAEGLAQRVTSGMVPENLLDKRIVALDLTKMLAGAKFRGDFEERIKNSIEEAIAAENIILFIDELHTLIGAGASEGSMDAANILKPALSRGGIQVVGATTLTEYRKHVEKDAALERRFQSIIVEEPSREEALAILKGLKGKYEEHHNLTIADEALEAAVQLSARYIQDRYLPDKAIDLIDEAASRVRTQKLSVPKSLKDLEQKINDINEEKAEAVRQQDYELAAELRDRQGQWRAEWEEKREKLRRTQAGRVSAEDVAAVVSLWTGVPVTMLTEDETKRLLAMEETLHRRVVGQEEAVKAVARAIRRGRVGLKDPKRPAGSFLFLGPTGVGKTELCKALAEALFREEDAVIRVDMSEFMERHTVSKLIGSPPGYVGYGEGGQLTEKVRRKPYSVILFDEIEKAHPDVWSILLQIMEDGRLTDGEGRKVDFKNTIVVMTSNAGAQGITDKRKALGFGGADNAPDGMRSTDDIRTKVMEELKRTFKPEFLNRIDDIIVFHQLDKEHITAIAGIMLGEVTRRLADMEIALQIEDSAIARLAQEGFDPVYGARPLRRVIQTNIEDPAAELILAGEFRSGDVMRAVEKDGKIALEKGEAAPESTKKPAGTRRRARKKEDAQAVRQ